MACFLVPTAEAIVTTVIAKTADSSKNHAPEVSIEKGASAAGTAAGNASAGTGRVPFTRKLRWLSNMLWGGAILLCFEHLWHGEVVPYPPFLTAAANPADTAEMLHEMSTVGVSMAALITAVWVGMVLVTNAIEKRAESTQQSAEQEM